jgi:hypothetical protein
MADRGTPTRSGAYVGLSTTTCRASDFVLPAPIGTSLDTRTLQVGTMCAVLETCRLVIDRPLSGDQHGLMYVAEPVRAPHKATIAASHVFFPDNDFTGDREARAQIESMLLSQGWQRDEFAPHGLIGVRFFRSSGP